MSPVCSGMLTQWWSGWELVRLWGRNWIQPMTCCPFKMKSQYKLYLGIFDLRKNRTNLSKNTVWSKT